MTNSELSRRLGIPKSSASYILRTLERRGYLGRDTESGRYRLGSKLLTLGSEVHANLHIADISLPYMRTLVERTGLTCHLAVLDRGEAVYIEKVEAPGFFKVNTWVGRRMFLHSASVGKSLIAWLLKTEIEGLLPEQNLKKRTPRTIASLTRMFTELERVRQHGYTVDDEENSPGGRCVGAPVFGSLGNVIAALGVSGTLSQLEGAKLPRVAETLKEAARKISRHLAKTGAA